MMHEETDIAVESCCWTLLQHLSPEVRGQILTCLLPLTPRIYTIFKN